MDRPQSINDLIHPKPGGTTQESRSAEQFQVKMHDIAVKQQERGAAREAAQIGLPYINLKGFPISPDAIGVVPEETALKLRLLCFYRTATSIRIGATDPQGEATKAFVQEVVNRLKTTADLYLISNASFEWAANAYKHLAKPRTVSTGVEITEEKLQQYQEQIKDYPALEKAIQTGSLTDVFTMILAAGIRFNTSDIHIEAEENDVKLRYRVDGILYDAAKLPPATWNRIISRIKLVAGMKMNITSVPQDGRITIKYLNDTIDVRLNTIPTAYGESVAMRLLRASDTMLDLHKLGLWGNAYHQMKKEISRPNGMVIITGPTGSGKTTTLYAVLQTLNKPETKIVTLEDPIEYKLEGINQSQVDASRSYTFAEGLRAIMRQDPDVVMVGEIRDEETAEIAIQSALTGHLVFSTIHTNSAAGAIPRFLAMGVPPFLLAPALNAIVGQRLVRKICPDCKEPLTLPPDMLETITKLLAPIAKDPEHPVDMTKLQFFKGRGCDHCSHLGYKGRTGIYEIMTMGQEMEKIILSGKVSEYTIQDLAIQQGMVTMVQDGLLKALAGITTVEEVFRVAE